MLHNYNNDNIIASGSDNYTCTLFVIQILIHCVSLSVHTIILAHSISLPGYLPIEVTNAVPTDPIALNAPPPPLPPRCDEDNRAAPQSPALDSGDREEQPPPIPVKSARTMPRSVS